MTTTVIGPLLFLVPVGFLGFVLYKAFGFMMIIAQPMADWIQVDTIVKGIKGGFDTEETQHFKPVALALGTAERVGFEIQKLADGRSMVFVERYGHGADELLATKVADQAAIRGPSEATGDEASEDGIPRS